MSHRAAPSSSEGIWVCVMVVTVWAGALSAGRTAIRSRSRGYAATMEILLIVALIVLVAAVVVMRKSRGKRPGEPESTGNDPK